VSAAWEGVVQRAAVRVQGNSQLQAQRFIRGSSNEGNGTSGVGPTRSSIRRRMLPRLGGRDMAIDLGTANTLVYVRGEGIVVSEPSVVASDTGTGAIHAVGDEAQQMIGRTPASISAVRPLRHGVIADFEITEQMLRHFMARVHGSRFAHPRVMMCAPSGITDVEQRALTEACLSAGARSVHLIEEPLAAAIGAGLAIDEPHANVVVDVGGGTSEVAVISLGGIVVSRSLRLGGYDLDETAAAWMRHRHGLAIGETTSERVKLEVGGVEPDKSDTVTYVRGRDPASGLPREVAVSAEEIRRALEGPVQEIVDEVKAALEETPPELASDLPQRGILLAGGGALLRGFAERVQDETKVPVRLADSPLTCVAEGAGHALDEMELLERTSPATAGGLGGLRRPG
jgi:rod shape-determining protein MreB and related proteins